MADLSSEAGFDAPSYGAASLADLLPSALASLGVAGEPNPLGLAPTRRACVLLVDGMGWELLAAHRAHAPFLASLMADDTGGPGGAGGGPVARLTSGFPSTTATSLTSLGTGLAPGHHGVFGYQVAVPGSDRVLNQLRWEPDSDIDPETWQRRETVYQRAERAGVATAYVASGSYEGTAFSRASARGSRYVAANDLTQLAVRAGHALTTNDRALVLVYHADLDTYGHLYGVDSDHWRLHLGHVDRLAEQLAGRLPDDGVLYVTADHGMVDSTPESRVDVEAEPDLRAGVRVLAGEARVRHVYTHDGAADDVLAAWRGRLGDRAEVVGRDEAIDGGLFGAVDPGLRPRIGDVLAVARGDTALLAPGADRLGFTLVGQHGSLTPAEVRVPLLRATANGAATSP